jgi:hypothetical protein
MKVGRPSLGRSDYIKAGAAKGLVFIGSKVPASVHDQTEWQCKFCGTIHKKSYRAVLYGKNGCTCQNERSLKPEDYNALADKLGIKWVGSTYSNRIPRNTKTPTMWEGRTGELVEASYMQLAYDNIPQRLREELGLG